jgi:mRNA interferase RelE/StbE
VDQVIVDLASEPRPEGSSILTGFDNLYRIRVGDWRMVYAIEEDVRVILVLEIVPRAQAYRNI